MRDQQLLFQNDVKQLRGVRKRKIAIILEMNKFWAYSAVNMEEAFRYSRYMSELLFTWYPFLNLIEKIVSGAYSKR